MLMNFHNMTMFRKILTGMTAIVCVALVSLIIIDMVENPFHKENFTTLVIANITQSHADYESGQACKEGFVAPIEVEAGQASGFAIKTHKNKTYILTAEHFCQAYIESDFDQMSYAVEIGSVLSVYDFEGDRQEGKVIYMDRELDLCLIETPAMNISHVNIALSMPEEGESVYVISAPSGISGPNFALHFEGRFSGCVDATRCYFSIPATFGSSGSVILNKRGQMIGMIQMASPSMHFLSIGVGNAPLFYFLNNASEELGIDFL